MSARTRVGHYARHLDALTRALVGIDLGRDERHALSLVAGLDTATATAIAGLLQRARQAPPVLTTSKRS